MTVITSIYPVSEDNEVAYAMACKMLSSDKPLKMRGDMVVKYCKKTRPELYAASECDRIEKIHGQTRAYWEEVLKVLNWEDELDVKAFIKWLRTYKSFKTILQSLPYLPVQPFIPSILNAIYGMQASWEDYKQAIAIALVMVPYLLADHDLFVMHPKEGTLKIYSHQIRR